MNQQLNVSMKPFMEQIHLPEEGRQCVLQYQMQEETYQNWKCLFYEKETEFFQNIEKQKEKEPLLLYLYVRFAIDLYPQYKEKGISDTVYYDTFSDFTIWSLYCRKHKNIVGLTREHWLKRHLNMRLFRLGRLQFEPDETEHRIHVHIPEGEPLGKEACDASFLQANSFFPDFYSIFDCKSWLLSPALLDLLKEESHIIQFQKRFVIQEVDKNARQAEERVFGEVRENKESYPEYTSLQRALKKYVLAGNNPGVAFGILVR